MMRRLKPLLLPLLFACLTAPVSGGQRRGAAPAPAGQKPATAAPFTTPFSAAEMASKQAVVNTSMGTIVIDLKPDLAPNHVGYFIKLAREHAYDGTTFHRLIRMAIIQGGDPLSKDPAKASLYGTG